MEFSIGLIVFIFGVLCLMLMGCDASSVADFSSLTTAPTNTPSLSVTPSTTPSLPGTSTILVGSGEIFLSEYAPNITVKNTFTFTGQVVKGQIFEKEIAHDLVFCLLPFNAGWRIIMSSKAQGGCDFNSPDYIGLLSPPFHGINPIFIEGWHFRNENNTGPNDGTVNAPQEKRWFNFLFNEENYHTVLEAHSCKFWNECDNMNEKQAVEAIANIPKSRGTLIITYLELGNLVPGERAWIESMEFEVELGLPDGIRQ